MKILCTGSSGFIGSHVVEELESRGHEVHLADIVDSPWHDNTNLFDMRNKDSVDIIFEVTKPDVVIHLSGILGTSETWDYPIETVHTNVSGTINILDACREHGCGIITVDVGSRWLAPYTITKRTAAEFTLGYGNKYGFKTGILRIFNVYGPRQSTKIIKIVPTFITKALANQTLSVWGDKYADLVHVRDVARAFSNAAERLDKINRVDGILIGSGDKITVYNVAKMIVDKIGSGKIERFPARSGEEMVDAGYMTDEGASKYLDWIPREDLSAGIDETIKYYRNCK